MRAGLPKREPELLNPEWAKITYRKLMDKNAHIVRPSTGRARDMLSLDSSIVPRVQRLA